MTGSSDRGREWIARIVAVLAAALFAVILGPYLPNAMTLLGFGVVLVGLYIVIANRSPIDSRLWVSAIVGVAVMIGVVTAFAIIVNDFGPAVLVVAVTAIVILAVERLLALTPYFRER